MLKRLAITLCLAFAAALPAAAEEDTSTIHKLVSVDDVKLLFNVPGAHRYANDPLRDAEEGGIRFSTSNVFFTDAEGRETGHVRLSVAYGAAPERLVAYMEQVRAQLSVDGDPIEDVAGLGEKAFFVDISRKQHDGTMVTHLSLLAHLGDRQIHVDFTSATVPADKATMIAAALFLIDRLATIPALPPP